MKTLFYIAVFAFAAYVVLRYAPVDHDEFHVDPAEPDPLPNEIRLIGLDAPRFSATASEVLEVLTKIATADKGVHVVAGDADEGMITFVTRTGFLGLRDYITVKAVDETAAAKLAILARPRMKRTDFGRNGPRLDRWIHELSNTFGG